MRDGLRRPKRSARFGVYLDRATRAALVAAARDEDVSATKLVERLIRDYLAATATRRVGRGRGGGSERQP
jgi:hypothetical protein